MSIGFLHGIRGSRTTKREDSEFDKRCYELRLKGHSPGQVRKIMEGGWKEEQVKQLDR